MKICTTGGRHFGDKKAVEEVLNQFYPQIDMIGVGDAPGADLLVRNWCRDKVVRFKVFVADWQKNGKAAGPIRNRLMIDTIKPDVLIAFPGGDGTNDCVSYVKSNYPDTEIIEVTPKQ